MLQNAYQMHEYGNIPHDLKTFIKEYKKTFMTAKQSLRRQYINRIMKNNDYHDYNDVTSEILNIEFLETLSLKELANMFDNDIENEFDEGE